MAYFSLHYDNNGFASSIVINKKNGYEKHVLHLVPGSERNEENAMAIVNYLNIGNRDIKRKIEKTIMGNTVMR